MPSNRDLLARAGDVLAELGIGGKSVKALTPATITSTSAAAGELMNRTQVEQLVDLTVAQNGWLSSVTMRVRKQRKSQISRLNLNEIVTEGVSEDDGGAVTTHPDTDFIEYETAKFKSTFYLTREAIREAAVSGAPNFDQSVRKAFAKAMGNDMARWTMRGDTTLAASSRENRLLRQRDGWLKQIRDGSGLRATTTRGSAWAQALYPSLMSALPTEHREDADLRWFESSLLDMAYQDDLRSRATLLGDKAEAERRRHTPRGIAQIVVPQMPENLGFATLSGTAVDADAIADVAGAVQAQVDTLLGGAAAANAGRVVSVTFDATGQSETAVVTWDGANNFALLTGSLGQTTISTTAADYTLDVADCTPVLCTNPRNLFIVMCDGIRAYRKFIQENEKIRIDIYYEATCGIFNENAIAMQDGVIVPSFTYGS